MRITVFTVVFLGTGLGGCLSVAPESEMVAMASSAEVEINVRRTDVLEVHVPAGDVSIVGEDSDTAQASLNIKCPADSRRCAAWAADAKVLAIREGQRVHIGVNVPARINASLQLDISLPRSHPLRVFMDYGDLDIRAMESDVSVKMKAGDVDIEMPDSAVDNVQLAARVGDASLRVLDRDLEGRRPLLVGARVDWRGAGTHNVDVKLRYGDVRLTLYP